MEIRILAEFVPFGDNYIKEHPYASLNEPFDELDLSSFAPETRKPWIPTRTKSSPYRLVSSAGQSVVEGEPLSSSIEESYDEELYISGSTVVWSRNNVFKRSFEFRDEKQPVQHALFAWFVLDEDRLTGSDGRDSGCGPWGHIAQDIINERTKSSTKLNAATVAGVTPKKKLQKALCVLLCDIARVYFINGESHTVHLPFIVHRAWPLASGGLLLQRVPDYEELYPPPCESDVQPPTEYLPVLFSLLDPFQEIAIISLTEKISILGSQVSIAEPIRAFSDWHHDIRFVHDSARNGNNRKTSIVVTFNRQTRRHHMFRYATKMSNDDDSQRRSSQSFRPSLKSTATTMQVPSSGGVSSPAAQSPVNRRTSLIRGESNVTMDRVLYTDAADTSLIGSDSKMKSVTFLEHVWVEDDSSSSHECESKVFIAHGVAGEEVLCIFKPPETTLSGYQLSHANTAVKVSKTFQCSAVSAIPINATRATLLDVLILNKDGSMSLWTGSGKIVIPCETPTNFQASFVDTTSAKRRRGSWTEDRDSSPVSSVPSQWKETSSRSIFRSPSRGSRVVELKDAVHNRVNLVFSDGFVFRAALPFMPTSNLVKTCLQALRYAMPSVEYLQFKSRFLEYRFGNASRNKFLEPGGEWEDFAVILLSFCHFMPQHVVATFAGKDIVTEDSEDDWEFLMSSTHHQVAQSDPAMRSLTSPRDNGARH